jgi:hypothetical protein
MLSQQPDQMEGQSAEITIIRDQTTSIDQRTREIHEIVSALVKKPANSLQVLEISQAIGEMREQLTKIATQAPSSTGTLPGVFHASHDCAASLLRDATQSEELASLLSETAVSVVERSTSPSEPVFASNNPFRPSKQTRSAGPSIMTVQQRQQSYNTEPRSEILSMLADDSASQHSLPVEKSRSVPEDSEVLSPQTISVSEGTISTLTGRASNHSSLTEQAASAEGFVPDVQQTPHVDGRISGSAQPVSKRKRKDEHFHENFLNWSVIDYRKQNLTL